MFPSDNYNHFPRYQGKFSGEEIDDLLSTVKGWKGGTSTGSGSLVFADPSVKSLQDWWSTALATTDVNESNGTKAISGSALLSWWNGKYIRNTAIPWDTITEDKVPSKGVINGQLNMIKGQLNALNGKLNTYAPKNISYTYTSLAARNKTAPASVYQWAFSDNTLVSNSRVYSQPIAKIGLILEAPAAEISTSSPVTGDNNLQDIGVWFSGADQNPFIWCYSDSQKVPAEWTTIRNNPSSPFSSMDITIPKIYLTPGDPEFVNRQLALSCFNFTNKITLQDGRITLYVYEGTCFSTSMLSTLQQEADNPGSFLSDAITSNGQDMKKSYVIFEVRLDTINVYWNLIAAF